MRCALYIALPVLLGGFAAGPAWGKSAEDELRAQIKSAEGQNNQQGAAALCGLLQQVTAKISANQRDSQIKVLREYEELANDIQDAIPKLTDPEAVKVLVVGLQRMDPRSQSVIAFGLAGQPKNDEALEAAAKVLAGSRDARTQVACMELFSRHQAKAGTEAILPNLDSNKLMCVQIAACRALANIRDRSSIPALIDYLEKWKSGRMKYEATAALRSITGQTFNPDAATWRGWWEREGKTFVVAEKGDPPSFNAELAGEKPPPGEEAVTYYEVPITENRIVFLIDTSGSMQEGGTPNRLERAKQELKDLVARLPDRTLFNIVLFGQAVDRMVPNSPLVAATKANKDAATRFIDSAKYAGSTPTMEALEEALLKIALVNGVETVFLITDGAPNPMLHSRVSSINDYPRGIAAIERRIRYINQVTHVRINTVGIYTGEAKGPIAQLEKHMRSFLQNVAKNNDGTYKEVN